MAAGERRLSAIMFTDVVGFTSLGQANEDLALRLLEEHREVVRPIIAKHGGVEVKTIGDAFLVEYPSVIEAVKSAMEIQRQMHDRNSRLQEYRRVMLRVGIHVGDVVHAQGDILGDAVNVSARIEPLAEPGGICISEQVYDHVRNKMGLAFERLERKTLKNVSTPIDIYRIKMPWESKEEQEPRSDPRRLAVLPLKNMSPDPNDEYFADGMTEELITSLSSVKGLTVIARTSVMQYKNASKRIAEIGRELSVGTLVEGSVRKAGNKVRITIQLIDAGNEGHLWAQNYDKELDDVFTVQSEVAQKVADALKVTLVESEVKRMERGGSKNPEAYNTYLKGMFYWNKRSPEGLRKCVELFEKAIQIDPSFALGYAGVAQAYLVTAANHYDDPEVYYPKAKEYALKALSLDDDLAEAHTVLAGVVEGLDRDLVKAESEFKRAIELNPSFATAHQWYSHILGWENRTEEGWREINRALELSPLSLIINTNVVDYHYFEGEYEEGIEHARRVIEMDPSFPAVYASLINCYIGASKYEEALHAAEKYSQIEPTSDSKLNFAKIYAHSGRVEEAKRLLMEIEAGYPGGQVTPFQIALVWFDLGETNRGFEWLEKAYQHHDRYVFLMAKAHELKGAKQDPRYAAMLEKTGLAGLVRD